ncbi:MAG: hypothetical protein U0869_15280 [Chloroflexota bacterium]
MHATTAHQIALQNQRRLLDQAAAARLARAATATRPSLHSRLIDALRRSPAGRTARPEPRPAPAGRA